MENSGKVKKPKEFSETRKIMRSFAAMLSALAVLSVYTYGSGAFAVITVSVLTAVAVKKICEEILKSDYPGGDLSGLVTGLMTAMLLPSTVPYYIPIFTATFAVLVCIVPFGTAKNSPFVPAAAAVCFAVVCFGEKMFAYPSLVNSIFDSNKIGMSLSSLLASGTAVKLNSAVVLEIITGQFPSALGTGFVIMLIGTLAYLLIRFPKNALPTLMFLVSASLFAIIFPRVKTGALTSFTMEICGGSLLFSAVFFMSYPSVIPTRVFSSAVWGFVSGIVCMMCRYFGKFEDSLMFGILFMNATASLFDEIPLTKFEKKRIENSIPYENTQDVAGVVPKEILSEIPDVSEAAFTENDKIHHGEDGAESVVQDDLHTAFTAENEIDENIDTLFNMRGDGNE